MSGIKIPVEAQISTGSVEAGSTKIVGAAKMVETAFKQAGKSNPFDGLQKTFPKANQQLLQAIALSKELERRLKITKQTEIESVADIDTKSLYPNNPAKAASMQRSLYAMAGLPTPAAPEPPAGGGKKPPSGGGGDGGGHWAQAGQQVVNAGINAAGPAARVVGGAVSAGMSGGIGAGLAGLLGGAAALALGKAIGSVMEKVGEAQTEAIGYDTLKRTLGDVNVSFSVLKESLRNSARNLDMTFDESQRLGTQFTKLSGLAKDQAATLGDEVTNAGGFARAFGMDPSQSTAFFAQMRQSKVTGSTQESRDLALMISEGIAKAGTFSKADDVLEAIAGFTAQQTRMGMNSANVSGYAELLTGLTRTGRAGLDPANAAALLGRVNASIAAGGANGEAGQNFLYSALGSRLGLNPIQAKILQEQGAFGTGSGTFGKGSAYAEFAERYGIKVPQGAAGSDVTNLQMIREKLDQIYRGQPELMADAMSNLFGVNISQAMSLASIDSTALGGLSARLKRNGIDVKDVNATGLSRLGQIEADKTLSDTEKDRLVKEVAAQNQEKTEGSETRKAIAGVERATVDMASRLLEPLNAMRLGIMYMAGEGKKSQREIQESMLGLDSKDRVNSIKTSYSAKLTPLEEKAENLAAKRRSLDPVALHMTYRDKPQVLEQKLREKADVEKAEKELLAQIAVLQKARNDEIEAENKRLAENLRLLREGKKDDVAQPAQGGSGGAGAGPGASPSTGRTYGSLAAPGGPRRRRSPGGGVGGVALNSDAAREFNAEAETEGLSQEERRLALAIYAQESGGGVNTTTSINGAVGHMQMLPATFSGYADKGWDINNPSHNRRAAMRYIKDLVRKSGGNLRTAAGAYYGGEKAINPDGSLKTFRNRMRPSDPTTQEYADDVVDRMAQVEPQQPPKIKREAPVAASVPVAPNKQNEPTTPMPAGVRPGDAMMGRQGVDVRISADPIYLLGQNGQPAAPPVNINTKQSTPAPSGTRS